VFLLSRLDQSRDNTKNKYAFIALLSSSATLTLMFKLFTTTDTATPLFPAVTLFNSESREAETFEPLSKKEVRLYSCGPTVYDYAHIGNLRAYVFADTLKRTLLYNGYNVNHTINYTDFGHLVSDGDTGEDKMMKGLKRENMEVSLESMRLLSDKFIEAFEQDMDSLNALAPTQYARASEYVTEQIKLIQTLEEKGYTYTTSDGVYFDISKFPTYGRLGKINVDELRSGARVEENSEKKHPADFAVWKNGDLGWDSSWGKGFPGWHIECSAMAFATLGKQIDIHTGGVDNMPTHHNGEIAQCESATGKQFSKYWMHSEHIQIQDEKIAKSEGNGIILTDLIEKGYTGADYRYWLLQSHYRSQVNFSFEALDAAKQGLTRLKRLVFEEWADERGKIVEGKQLEIVTAINNDLDTPKVIAMMHDISKDTELTPGERKALILECDAVLGLGLSDDPEEGRRSLGHVALTSLPQNIMELIDQREAARIARNWTEADRLRDAIILAGYTLEDSSDGPKVTKQ
jgi:cysteinyl-tRNA synthetase